MPTCVASMDMCVPAIRRATACVSSHCTLPAVPKGAEDIGDDAAEPVCAVEYAVDEPFEPFDVLCDNVSDRTVTMLRGSTAHNSAGLPSWLREIRTLRASPSSAVDLLAEGRREVCFRLF